MFDWGIGIVASAIIAGFAYWRHSLSSSGFAAALVLGTIIYALGGIEWAVPLIAFFASATLLSKWKQRNKAALESHYEKTGRRDAGQVMANGGIGMLLCIAHAVAPHPYWWFAYVGTVAAVNADTWATEIGGLSRRKPRSLISWKAVPAGTSGGVTLLGLTASASGGLFIGITAATFANSYVYPAVLVPITLMAGFLGALIDSILGATLQRMYRCVRCGREIETAHHCGEPATESRGIRFFTNDTVNMLCGIIGGAVSVGLFSIVLQ